MKKQKGGFEMADEFQNILALLRAAVQKYEMLAPGDRVAVGVSGGKDSVLLLAALARLRTFYPAPFTLTAITLDPGFDGREGDYTPIAALCERFGIPYHLCRTHLWEVVFEERREKNPCSLCARMRRGALHKAAKEAGCNVLALGHHKDDAAQTFVMNLLDGGTLGSFSPKTYLDRRDLTLIRPLIFVDEAAAARCVTKSGLPVVASRCPVDGCTNRRRAKDLLDTLAADHGAVNDKILGAMQKAGISGW